jgi:arginine/lysine/histidine transporter system substrate-binding protein
MKKTLLAVLTLVFILSGCVQQNTPETITILTSSGYPPYEMVDEDGNLIGFDIDFGNALGEKLGVEVKWEDMDFDGIIGSLNSNRGTMAIAAMSPDPERDVDFSVPYYIGAEESPFFILTLADGGVVDSNDLVGKKVGTQIGTIQESLLNKIESEFSFITDPKQNVSQLVQEVITGRLDFVIIEGPTAREYVLEFPVLTTFELSHPEVTKYIEEVSGVSVALPRGSEWTSKVNEAIEALIADGTMDALIKKWFTE